MRKNNIKKTYAFILVTLFLTFFSSQIVIADESIIDDTFEPASFIDIAISNHKATPSTVDIGGSSTISFRASFTWPGLIFATDYSLRLIRDSSNSVLKTWTGTAKKGSHEYVDVSFSIPLTHTSTAGTFSYTIKAYRRSLNQFKLMETKKVTLKVVDTTPTYSITGFSISPTSIAPGETTKFSVTSKFCNIAQSTLFTLKFIDSTESKTIGILPLIVPRTPNSCRSVTRSVTIGANITSSLKPGSHTIKVELKKGITGSVLSYKTYTLNITSPGPDSPTPMTIPKTAETYQTVSLVAKVTHPSNAKCQVKWDYGDGSSSSWSSLFATPSTPSITTKYTKDGSYTIKAQVKDEHGKTSASTTMGTIVISAQEPTPMVSLTAYPSEIKKGDPVRLSWVTSNADYISISGVNIGYQPVSSGYVTVYPTSTTKYTATVTGGGKTANDYAKVTISSGSDPTKTMSVELTATKTTINYGETTTLTWQSINANSVTINNGISTGGDPSGYKIISPQLTTTYTATATGDSGTTTDSITITVQIAEEDDPTAALGLSTSSIIYGGSAILSWSSTNANSVTINNGVETNNALFGSVSVSPPSTTTYVMNAIGAGETATTTITLTVNPPTDDSDDGEEKTGIGTDTILYIVLAVVVFACVAYYVWREKKKDNSSHITDKKSRFEFLSKYFNRGKKKQKTVPPYHRYDHHEPRYNYIYDYDSSGYNYYDPHNFDEIHYRNRIKRKNKNIKYPKNKNNTRRRKK